MTADVGSVDVRDRNIEASSRSSDFLCGRHNRLRSPQNLSHGVTARNTPKGAMLDLSRRPNDRPFPVPFDRGCISAQDFHQFLGHFKAEWFQVIHEAGDVFHVLTGKWVMDNGQHGGASQRDGCDRPALVEDLFEDGRLLSDSYIRHARVLPVCASPWPRFASLPEVAGPRRESSRVQAVILRTALHCQERKQPLARTVYPRPE